MTLIINGRFLTQNITGVQRFAIEIVKQLKAIDPTIEIVCPRNVLDKALADQLNVRLIGKSTGHVWEQLDLPKYLKEHHSPLLLNLTNTAPINYKNKAVVVHDVAFEKYPQSFSRKFRLLYKFLIPRILHSSKKIFTVSEFSKNEIKDLYSYDKEIVVIHNSVSEIFKPMEHEGNEQYILAVSSLNYQKNFHSLIKAFNLLKVDGLKLYLVGGLSNSFRESTIFDEIKGNDHIVLKGRVDDAELCKLYSNALCFVFPSYYEGFGIPPIEAQACGCPVIASDIPSLNEICAESVVYCNPYDIHNIAQQIQLVVTDTFLQDKLRNDGFENIKRFSCKTEALKLWNALS